MNTLELQYVVKYNLKFKKGLTIQEWGTDTTNVFVKDFSEIVPKLMDSFVYDIRTTYVIVTVISAVLQNEQAALQRVV